MSTELITVLVFGVIGYIIGPLKIFSPSHRVNIVLVVVLIIAANTHGLGFSGVGEFRLYHNDILQGIIGGILIRRMSGKVASTA